MSKNICPSRILNSFAKLSLLCLLAFLVNPNAAFSQSATATLTGTVVDPNGASVPGVTVKVLNPSTGIERTVTTNDDGFYSVSLLPAATYTVAARRDGFIQVQIKDVVLNANDQRALRIELKVGDVNETVTVTDEAPLIDESASIATTVDRQIINNVPLNGRTFQSLIALAPGVVLTGGNGQFSVNGQRSNANYFTVDGVGANADVSTDRFPGQSLTGSAPSLTTSGTTQNLVSVDALQEFNIQTSTYAPEFGRTPGGQVSAVTRSGTNTFHGALFEYFRNEALDANDWFANRSGFPKPPLRMNDFGGVVGGPLYLPRFGEGGPAVYSGKDKTFFFFSYEGLRLSLPQTRILVVPTLITRQNAAPAVRLLLNALPIPNGRDLGNGTAEFNAVYSDPSSIDAYGLRIDHKFTDKVNIFGRYSYTPSDSQTRSGPVVAASAVSSRTLTLGTTWIVSSKINNDLRFNYTRLTGATTRTLDNFGGAQPIDTSNILPSFATLDDSIFAVTLPGFPGFQIGKIVNNLQRQINLVDNVSIVQGGHQLKFGVDYRRLYPLFNPLQYNLTASFLTPASLQTASARFARQAQDAFVLYFNNLSLYGQDTWRVNKRTTLTYGLRWELVPPPHGDEGNEPLTITNLNNINALTFAPRGTPLWKTRHNDFAPRAGISYALSQKPGRETVMRGGFGMFYDLGTGTVFGTAARNPFFRGLPALTTTYPLAPSLAVRPPLSLTGAGLLAFTDVTVFDQQLKLPYTLQWNASLEQSLGSSQTITLSYVGAAGRRLLRNQFTPGTNFGRLDVTTNIADSDYDALQVQFNRRLSRGLQVLSSYTWSKSFDSASSDASLLLPGTLVSGNQDRGPSDFDVRHVFSGALTYDIPSYSEQRIVKSILGGWSVNGLFRAQSAYPVNVTFARSDFGNIIGGFRPDLVSGVPLYIEDPSFPGGRRINLTLVAGNPNQIGPFQIPTTLRQGTLGRNALRGFPFHQLDLGLTRRFSLTERVKLQFRSEFFNVLNHPNFASPDGFIASVSGTTVLLFPGSGVSTQMFGRGLGGVNPIFQVGGPRSIQFALRLEF